MHSWDSQGRHPRASFSVADSFFFFFFFLDFARHINHLGSLNFFNACRWILSPGKFSIVKYLSCELVCVCFLLCLVHFHSLATRHPWKYNNIILWLLRCPLNLMVLMLRNIRQLGLLKITYGRVWKLCPPNTLICYLHGPLFFIFQMFLKKYLVSVSYTLCPITF